METSIVEPLDSLGVVFFLTCAVVSLARARDTAHTLLSWSLLVITVSQAMKSLPVFGFVYESGQSAVMWRAVVQILCLAAMLLLVEALRCGAWGALWTRSTGRRAARRLTAVSLILLVLAWGGRHADARIEDLGGVLPGVYLAVYAVSLVVLAAVAVSLLARYGAAASLLRVGGLLVTVGFAVDGITLLTSYVLTGGAEGREDNGTLWLALWPAAVLVVAGSLHRQEVGASAMLEERVLSVWRALYDHKHGAGASDGALERRRSAGITLAWVVIIRESVDIIAAESRKVPLSSHTPERLLPCILLTSPGTDTENAVASAPYPVRSVSDIGALSAGLTQ